MDDIPHAAYFYALATVGITFAGFASVLLVLRRCGAASVVMTLTAILSFSNVAIAAPTELLSLRRLPVGEDQYIDQFHIQTWGVRILAVCHIPVAWRITAGKFLDAEGTLSGETEAGMAYMRRSDLPKLEQLFLVSVDTYQPQAKPQHPATFAGTVHLGTFGGDEKGRTLRLKAENFLRVPAARCPG